MEKIVEAISVPVITDSQKSDKSSLGFNILPLSDKPVTGSLSLKVLSYNILADAYVTKKMASKFSGFEYRSNKIIAELKEMDCDVICLQEVDHYDFFAIEIEKLGYSHFFAKRPQANLGDGCLIGVKKDKFEIMESTELPMTKGYIHAMNVAILVKIKEKITQKVFNIACTHLFWNPKFEHVKYYQLTAICQLIQEKVEEGERVVICGDLNSFPDTNLTNLLTKKEPPRFFGPLDTAEKLEAMKEHYTSLKSFLEKFTFDNAYRQYGKATNNKDLTYPPHTNYTPDFRETLDHIFFTPNGLELKGLLEIPTAKQIVDDGLPNERYPSDHLPIMALFEVL